MTRPRIRLTCHRCGKVYGTVAIDEAFGSIRDVDVTRKAYAHQMDACQKPYVLEMKKKESSLCENES